MYNLFETHEFIKSLKNLQNKDGEFVKTKLLEYVYPQISKEPHAGPNIKKLKNYSPETWRYRIGKYRLFYSIEDEEKLVLLLVIENRKNAY